MADGRYSPHYPAVSLSTSEDGVVRRLPDGPHIRTWFSAWTRGRIPGLGRCVYACGTTPTYRLFLGPAAFDSHHGPKARHVASWSAIFPVPGINAHRENRSPRSREGSARSTPRLRRDDCRRHQKVTTTPPVKESEPLRRINPSFPPGMSAHLRTINVTPTTDNLGMPTGCRRIGT